MVTGWRYRIVSAAGVVAFTVVSVLVANHPEFQHLFTTYVPVFNRLEEQTLTGPMFLWAVGLCSFVMIGCLLPLYKPRPRRVLDTIFLTQKRVVTGGLAIATFGFFKWSHRLPRATLVMVVGLLSVAMPLWFVSMRRRPPGDSGRTLLVGDDPDQIKQITTQLEGPILGYLCPTNILSSQLVENGELDAIEAVPDGGIQTGDGLLLEYDELTDLDRLGGLSRIEDVLVEYDVDTVVLAFHQPDRAEFFGALDACFEHGVDAKVHREYADSVLVSEGEFGELVDIDLEPWDPLDSVFKRLFDVVFALVGLVVFAPLMVLIGAAIRLDSPGPILYSQERTAGLGETFTVSKFRTMVQEGESATPAEDGENDRITRVGRVLRKTHMDELPQLMAILLGRMSVVGPRAAWTDEEQILERETASWRKRWFVKPGLTGLAQINDAKSTEPDAKLRYDLEYIRRQSFWFDLKIVLRQVWKVCVDTWETISS
ncbi:sugar transferase [Halostagnicola larsenii XH-48]|uniref:Sugar transferase n=1 Tax=Halostagnicola larsenii XH-48 TaxID=797299 RepID=W0JLM7_9EURY|nr:sugar transferase [Halostagnicola larsenii]AHF99640.1 sugar transferase [Halostagnicola larsenii XH-48]